DREPCTGDGPALAGLELASRPVVLTEEAREGSQEPPEVGPTDLPGDPEGLDEPVGDRVREPCLEVVKALVEASRRTMVGREARELAPELDRPTVGELRERLREREAGTHSRHEVVDDLGPDLPHRLGPRGGPGPHDGRRRARGDEAEAHAER